MAFAQALWKPFQGCETLKGGWILSTFAHQDSPIILPLPITPGKQACSYSSDPLPPIHRNEKVGGRKPSRTIIYYRPQSFFLMGSLIMNTGQFDCVLRHIYRMIGKPRTK